MKAYLAFYKYSGDWIDYSIRWGTNSIYSHTEIIVDEGEDKLSWYSSSPRDGGVRKMNRDIDTDRWDLIELEIDYDRLIKLYEEKKGAGYDYICIGLTHIIPLGIHHWKWETCSEFCAHVLKHPNPHYYNPQDLYEIHKKLIMKHKHI